MTVRATVKRALEKALVGSGLARRRIRREGAGAAAVLAYHDIVPRGERVVGERSLHLPQDAFGDQLDALLETHEVVRLESIVQPPEPGGRPVAALTFDDAYLGALTAGLEEIRKRGLPATVFVNPGALEWDGFWWDRLADVRSGILAADIRGHALSALGGRQAEILRWAGDDGLPLAEMPAYARAAPLDVLRSFDSDPSITFGSHSWKHARLPDLEPNALLDDLTRTRSWLDANLAHTVRWLAYPYGHVSEGVRAVTARVEEGAVLVEGGTARRPIRPEARTAVPRINISSGVSTEGFILRL